MSEFSCTHNLLNSFKQPGKYFCYLNPDCWFNIKMCVLLEYGSTSQIKMVTQQSILEQWLCYTVIVVYKTCIIYFQYIFLDSKVHVAHMGPTWVLSAPGRPHKGPMKLAIRVSKWLWYPECTNTDLYFPLGSHFVNNGVPYGGCWWPTAGWHVTHHKHGHQRD